MTSSSGFPPEADPPLAETGGSRVTTVKEIYSNTRICMRLSKYSPIPLTVVDSSEATL